MVLKNLVSLARIIIFCGVTLIVICFIGRDAPLKYFNFTMVALPVCMTGIVLLQLIRYLSKMNKKIENLETLLEETNREDD